MADNTKKLIQIVVLVTVDAKDSNDARTLGGNLARQIQANIPAQYEIVGVELADVSDENPKPAPRNAKDEEKTLRT